MVTYQPLFYLKNVNYKRFTVAQSLLFVKLSSLGDVIHAFACLTEVKKKVPDVRIAWAVEEAFADFVASHVAVDEVIAVPFRRLKKVRGGWRSPEAQTFFKRLKAQSFDKGVDAQGLLKSALLMRMASVKERIGYASGSAREPLSSLFYQKRVLVASDLHAVERMRLLMGSAFAYSLDKERDYGLPLWKPHFSKTLLFFHGTTWNSKLLPEETWFALIEKAIASGYHVKLPWGNEVERMRAERLAIAGATVLPPLSLCDLQAEIYHASGVISVDTGLGHLAAACGAPVLGIFGSTNAVLTGMLGVRAKNMGLPQPCMQKDCRKHGGMLVNSCIAKQGADDIWNIFLNIIHQ